MFSCMLRKCEIGIIFLHASPPVSQRSTTFVILFGVEEENREEARFGETGGVFKEDMEKKYGTVTVEGIGLNMRCQVSPGNRRGSIAFVGIIPELGGGGHWLGVIFDEPVGKTDGTTVKNGKRYFAAPGPKYGGFTRGKNVAVGDFPERNIMDESDDDSEDEL